MPSIKYVKGETRYLSSFCQIVSILDTDTPSTDGGGFKCLVPFFFFSEDSHEDPKSRQSLGTDQDATKDEGQGKGQVGNVATRLGVVDAGDDHVGKGAGEEQKDQDEQEHQGAPLVDRVGGFRVVVQADRVVPGDEDQKRTQHRPRQLGDDVGHHEGLPGVGLAGTFSDLVQGPLSDEQRHDLLDELTEDGHQHEDAKHLIRQTLDRVAGLEKGEADEQALPRQNVLKDHHMENDDKGAVEKVDAGREEERERKQKGWDLPKRYTMTIYCKCTTGSASTAERFVARLRGAVGRRGRRIRGNSPCP